MTLLHVVIAGAPVGKAPARTFMLHGRAVTTTPPKTRAWQTEAALLIREAWGDRPPLDEPVSVEVLMVVDRPKRLCGKKADPGRIPATCKPDCSNVLKAAEDACTRAGVWCDDSRVADVRVRKFYRALAEGPKVELFLWRTADQRPEAA